MTESSAPDVDPAAVSLPPSDGIRYSSPVKSPNPFHAAGYESTPQTARPKQVPIANIFDTETPVVSNSFNPFKTPYADDEETPRARPSRRGGKYHPGSERKTPARTHMGGSGSRSASPESSPRDSHHSRHSSRQNSVSDSEAEVVDGADMGADDIDEEDEEEGEQVLDEGDALDHHDGMDRTTAINLESSVVGELGGAYPTSARSRRMMSPGRTPARKMSSRNNDSTPGLNLTFDQNTPRSTAFTNTSLPPSLFADIQATPFLSVNSPHKMSQRMVGDTPLSLSAVLRAKEEEVRRLREMLEGTQDDQMYDDLIDFSPEKKDMDAHPEDLRLSVRKRRSPRKKHAITSPISGPPPRTVFRSSPIKPAALFDGVTKPITAEERRRARRRRVTQEFRDFSSIDLESLKSGGLLPKPSIPEVIEEETTEIEIPEAPEQEKEQLESVEEQDEPEEEEPAKAAPADAVMAEKEEDTKEEEDVAKQEEGKAKVEVEEEAVAPVEDVPEVSTRRRSSITVPPLNRARKYRSHSAPPTPRPEDVKVVAPKILDPIPMDVDAAHDAELSKLHATIAELRDQLEIADVQMDRLKAEIVAERRLRITAQEAREFVELERKFGVCCEHNPKSKQPQEKLGPAAIQLPNSSPPAHHVAPPAKASRLNRPVSRYGDRPASRLGGLGDHPSSSTGSRYGDPAPPPIMSRLGNYAKPTVAAPATRKRAREESKKAPIPARPEKRVLSGSAAGNIMLGSQHQQSQSGLAKKPEKVVGRSLRSSSTTNSTTGTGRPGALSRGARR